MLNKKEQDKNIKLEQNSNVKSKIQNLIEKFENKEEKNSIKTKVQIMSEKFENNQLLINLKNKEAEKLEINEVEENSHLKSNVQKKSGMSENDDRKEHNLHVKNFEISEKFKQSKKHDIIEKSENHNIEEISNLISKGHDISKKSKIIDQNIDETTKAVDIPEKAKQIQLNLDLKNKVQEISEKSKKNLNENPKNQNVTEKSGNHQVEQNLNVNSKIQEISEKSKKLEHNFNEKPKNQKVSEKSEKDLGEQNLNSKSKGQELSEKIKSNQSEQNLISNANNKKQIESNKSEINKVEQNLISNNIKQIKPDKSNNDMIEKNFNFKHENQEILDLSDYNKEDIINLKRIFDKFIGLNEEYEFEIFTKIYNITGRDIIKLLNQKLKNDENESLLDIIMPLFVSQLKVGTDISNILLDEIFCLKKSSNLYGIDLKTAIACMLFRYKHHHFKLINLLKKQTIPIPIIYKIYNRKNKGLSYNFPLRAFSNILSMDSPCVINMGERKIGKTTLLNMIYFTKFYTSKGVVNGGVDVCFNCEEYASGFNIFDINEDINNDKIVELTFNCVNKNSIWVIIHVTRKEDCNKIIEKLRELGIKDNQLIIIFRDCIDLCDLKQKDNNYESYLNSLENNNILVLSIEKTPLDQIPSFMSSLSNLRSKIFCKTGIGPKAKSPYELCLKTKNIYWINETNVKKINSSITEILLYDDNFKEFSLEIENKLNNLPKNIDNYQDLILTFLSQSKLIGSLEKSKNELKNEVNDLQSKLADIDNKIATIDIKIKKSKPHELIVIFNKIFLNKKFYFLQEFDRAINTWLTPIIKPIIEDRQQLLDNLGKLKKDLNNELKYSSHNSNLQISKLKKDIDHNENKVCEIGKILDMKLINIDLLSRELFTIYTYLKNGNLDGFDRKRYLDSLCDYLIQGNEIEIIDGDNNNLNINVIEEIFLLVQTKLNWQNTSPFVVAVIGPQSTGKSTLLNMLFGSNFQMSAGRCTKGLYASIFKTDFKEMGSLIVLDTEGLLSIERNSEEFDRKLTLFSMACSNVTLININGEINSSMKKILTISLFAAKQLNMFRIKPVIIFVLRNMMDLDKSKQSEMICGVNKALAEVISESSDSNTEKMSLCEILDFRNEDSFFLMLSAFNKDSVSNQEYGENVELFQNYKTNNKFSNLISELRNKIVNIAKQIQDEKNVYNNLSDWIKNAGNIWDSINNYNDLFLLDSIKEIRERSFLSDKLNEIVKKYISNSSEYENTLNNEIDRNISEYENNDIEDEKINFDLKDIKLRYEETVLINFGYLVKNSNCDTNLIKEYKNNLKSIIESNYNNAWRNLQSIKDKKGIKTILSDSIKCLSLKFQRKIIEWQERSKSNSKNQNKDVFKNSFLNDLKQELYKEEDKIKKKLYDQKKSDEKIKEDIYAMFLLSYNSASVEKRFFSINTIHKKRTSIGDKLIFMDIFNRKDDKEYFDKLLKIIPYYFRYDDLIREKNKRETIIKNNLVKQGEKFSTEIEVKVDEKDMNIFKKVWNSICNFFTSTRTKSSKSVSITSQSLKKSTQSNSTSISKTTERKNSVINRAAMFESKTVNKNENSKPVNNKIEVKNNEMIIDNQLDIYNQIDTISIDSLNLAELLGEPIIAYIKYLLEETFDFLTNNIRVGIFDKKHYNYNNLKDHLYSVYEKLTIMDLKLKPNFLILSTNFKDDIVSWMFDILLERIRELNEIQLNECISQFTNAKEKSLENLKQRLEKDFGDVENSREIASLMIKNLRKYCIKNKLVDYIKSLKSATNKLPQELLNECYNIFKTNNRDEIFLCVTDFNTFIYKIYEKGFKEENDKLQKKIMKDIDQYIKSEKDKITEILRYLIKMFKNKNKNKSIPELSSEIDSKHIFSFIKAFFENKIKASEISKKINENGRFYLNWDDFHINCISAEFIFGKNTDQEISHSIYSIENPELFLECLLNNFSNFVIKDNTPDIFQSSDILSKVDEILNSNFCRAKGCMETCPYCGSKCTAIHGDIIDEKTKHSTDKHLLMAFKGCYEYCEDGKQFVFDLCNSKYNLTQSKWIDSKDPNILKNNKQDNIEIRQRMSNYGIQGVDSEVRFTVMWDNWNDLDLRVRCPCGTEIYYGHTKCHICQGYLETDMNVCSHIPNTCTNLTMQGGKMKPSCTNKPVENIIFEKNAPVGEYKCWLTMAGENKQNCGYGAKWECEVSTCNGIFLQTLKGIYPNKFEVGTFTHSLGVNFLTHAQKYYNNWAGGIKEENDERWELDLRNSFYIISEKMSNNYNYINNCQKLYVKYQ